MAFPTGMAFPTTPLELEETLVARDGGVTSEVAVINEGVDNDIEVVVTDVGVAEFGVVIDVGVVEPDDVASALKELQLGRWLIDTLLYPPRVSLWTEPSTDLSSASFPVSVAVDSPSG